MKGSGIIPPRFDGERRWRRRALGRAAQRRPYTDNDRTPASIAALHFQTAACDPKPLKQVPARSVRRLEVSGFCVQAAKKSPFPGLLYQWLLNNLPGGEPGNAILCGGIPRPRIFAGKTSVITAVVPAR